MEIGNKRNKFIKVAAIILLILTTLIFLKDPGAGDLQSFWIKWANNANVYGVAEGFKANARDYPPLVSLILFCSLKVSKLFEISDFVAIKICIFFFLLLTSFIFFIITRDLLSTVLLHLSLILGSVALAYIDVLVFPFLILSFWALKKHKLILFSILFTISFLIKWQPIIILPFIVIYIIDINKLKEWKKINFKELIIKILSPAIIILIIIISIYGFRATRDSLILALSEKSFLSGNALNFNWILTHFLHVFQPDKFGSLVNGKALILKDINIPITLTVTSKTLFILLYLLTCISFFKSKKSFENLLLYSIIGFFAYFSFNTGVHENHLIYAMVLSVFLYVENKGHLYVTLILILITNINMFLFYGYAGNKIYGDFDSIGFSRVIKNLDIALVLSIFNVVFFLILWVLYVILPIKQSIILYRQEKAKIKTVQ